MEKKEYLNLYYQMVVIRLMEERAAELYQQGKIGGFLHLYIGQEAVSTGLISARRPEDRVITAYRDHGVAIVGAGPTGFYAAEHLMKQAGLVVEVDPDRIRRRLETGYLDAEAVERGCRCAERGGAAFVKTSTGFGSGGATVADVRLMRRTVGERFGVKAAGGIRTYKDRVAMIEAGANRIGTSSAVQILKECPA